jgi:hypothetical protein
VAGLVVTTAILQLSVGVWVDTLLGAPGHELGAAVAGQPATGAGSQSRHTARLWPLIAGATISAIAALYQRFVDLSWLSGEPWVSTHRAIGLMGDANPLGVASAVCAPLALVFAPGGLAVGAPLAVLLWIAAWTSGARSTLLFLAVSVAGLLVWFTNARGLPRRTIVLAAAGGIVATLVAFAAVRPFVPPGSPIARFVASIPTDTLGDAAYELFWRRDGYGVAAAAAIADHPVTGVGIGVFNSVSSGYYQISGGRAVPPDNAQNLWRQTLAERGVLGLLPVLWLTWLSAAALVRRRDLHPMTRAALLGLGVALVFGLPVQNPGIAVTAALLVAMVGAGTDTVGDARGRDTGPRALAMAVVSGVAIASAGVDAAVSTRSLTPAVRSARLGVPYAWRFDHQDAAPDGTRGRVIHDRAAVAMGVDGPRFTLRGFARANTRFRVWHDGVLVVDQTLEDGTIFTRTMPMRPDARGMALQFESSGGDVLILGTFSDGGESR